MNIILVEDNPVQQDLISLFIEDCNHNLLATFNNAEDAKSEILSQNPDLVLLDINLDGHKNGIELANDLKSKGNSQVIFITSQTQSEILDSAVSNNPLDILIKPVIFEQFQASLMLAEAKLKQNQKPSENTKFILKGDYFVYKNGHLFERTLMSELQYVEGMGNYFNLHFEKGKVTIKGTLSEIEDALPNNYFIRINRSIIIAFDRIKSFNVKRIFMENGQEFPLSKKVSEDLIQKLM